MWKLFLLPENVKLSHASVPLAVPALPLLLYASLSHTLQLTTLSSMLPLFFVYISVLCVSQYIIIICLCACLSYY